MQEVSKGNRLNIGIFGACNSGKSTLLNAICGQDVAMVSAQAGTTTDPVYKAMEIRGVGAVTLIDTAGYDDISDLGAQRMEATDKAMKKCDMAIVVLSAEYSNVDKHFISEILGCNIPMILLENYHNYSSNSSADIAVNALKGVNIDGLLALIAEKASECEVGDISLLRGMVEAGDTVILVMPQDIAAPKGRLILPQTQTIRELLDKKAVAVSVTTDGYEAVLASLKKPPKLVICDSQTFAEVDKMTDISIDLTSFSMLLARQKGDITAFISGANAIDHLKSTSRVLIAEACTHAPVGEDIGRVKIPLMLNRLYGVTDITMVSGENFPDSVGEYDLVIHCGACMFNRRMVMLRISISQDSGCPITNYGVAIAKMNGILERCKI